MIDKNSYLNSNRNIFNDIDISLLFGIQCSSGSQTQQNYLEKLKVQTETAFANKKFKVS